jgi:hypothetical protein
MKCDFSEQVSRLVDGELEDGVTAQVRTHIASCASCQQAEDDFIALRSRIKFFAAAPGAAERRQALSHILAHADMRRRWHLDTFWKQPATAFATSLAAAVCAAILITGVALNINRTPMHPEVQSASWQVARIEGAPRVGASGINKDGRLQVGEWLETDAASRAKVDVADIGHVEVDPNSRLRLVETNPSEHRLALAEGKIHAQIYAPPRLFFVDTPSAIAVDYGCAYTLEVDAAGRSILHVTAGWVALEANGNESFVPAGAVCAAKPGKIPGTPYFEDAPARLRAALEKLDFGNLDSTAKTAALDSVLKEARRHDGLTLWHLLTRVDETERERVYERLAGMVSPPAGVTRDGVLRGDKRMLESWKASLE